MINPNDRNSIEIIHKADCIIRAIIDEQEDAEEGYRILRYFGKSESHHVDLRLDAEKHLLPLFKNNPKEVRAYFQAMHSLLSLTDVTFTRWKAWLVRKLPYFEVHFKKRSHARIKKFALKHLQAWNVLTQLYQARAIASKSVNKKK